MDSRKQRRSRRRVKRYIARLLVLLILLSTLVVIVTAQHLKTPAGATEVIDAEATTSEPEQPRSTEIQPVETPVVEDVKPGYLHSDNVPLPDYLQETMQRACEEYGVPYSLALAITECESSFDLEADSGVCWGLMQIHPINNAWLRELGIEPTEYEGNIVAGVLIIGQLLDKYGDTHKALMAYNCGETGAARLWNQGYFTTSYSRKVIQSSEKWQQIINGNIGG